MLSYRHAFHAGNFADVLKHLTLTLSIEHMKRKVKPFTYIDTHAGAGIYSLQQTFSQKTGEYKNGIELITSIKEAPNHCSAYLKYVKQLNPKTELSLYPGSVAIAKKFLREQDNAHMFELHPSDHKLLTAFCQRWRKSFVHSTDGYQGLLSLLPPPSRRGIVLIDPPYEIKSDYRIAVQTLIKSHQKFSTGCYLLWYPVVNKNNVTRMQNELCASPLKNILQIEFCKDADNHGFGMTGSGLFVVNPPWELNNQMQVILPYLQKVLGDKQSFYKLEQMVNE